MNRNNIKAVVAALFTALILICLNTGCSKNKIPQVTNNKDLEKLFYGTWTVTAKAEVELYTNPNTDDQKYYGKATILSSNVLEFSENQVYSMKISSSLDTIKLTDNAVTTEEELRKQIENSILIRGTFSADNDYLELLSETVEVNGTQTYTAKEYAQMDSNYGSEKQIVKWNLLADTLEFSDLNGNAIVTYNKL